jgi:hypothetical protein
VFEDLERDLSLHRLLLLRYVHRRKTTLADLFEQPVPSDYVSRPVHLHLAPVALDTSLIAAKPCRANNR